MQCRGKEIFVGVSMEKKNLHYVVKKADSQENQSIIKSAPRIFNRIVFIRNPTHPKVEL